MKFGEPRSFADPDAAARKLVEIANGIEADRKRKPCWDRKTQSGLHRILTGRSKTRVIMRQQIV